jgi:hypothetical protein
MDRSPRPLPSRRSLRVADPASPAGRWDAVLRWARALGRPPRGSFGLGRPLQREEPLLPPVVIVTTSLGVIVLAGILAGLLAMRDQAPAPVSSQVVLRSTAPTPAAPEPSAEPVVTTPAEPTPPPEPSPSGSQSSQPAAPADLPPDPPTLQVGSQGPDVAALQESLTRLGMLQSPPTGSYDDQTWAAVRAFQGSVGGTGDPEGVFGPATRSALTAVLLSRG